MASPGAVANIPPSPGEISRRWAGEELAELVHKHNLESQEAYKIAHGSLLENKQKAKCESSPYALDESGKYNDFSTSNASPKMDKEVFLSTYNKGRGAYLETTLRSRTASNVFNKTATPAPKAKYFRRTARELEVECHSGFKSTYDEYMAKNLDLLKSKGANRSASNIFNSN
mmetsp:Transcript_41893/g.111584  ORF Transcript_41893/g.111584 Transcript_41893/m.111584 type:complete len:172 (+) Transcript_41893:274-789(+)